MHWSAFVHECLVQVMHELVDAVLALDADRAVRAIIITGRGKAFAAGADIREMADLDEQQVDSCTTTNMSRPLTASLCCTRKLQASVIKLQ